MTETKVSEEVSIYGDDEQEWKRHLGNTGLHYYKLDTTPSRSMTKVELSHIGHEYEPKIGETVVFELAQRDINASVDNEPKACVVADSFVSHGYGRVYVLREGVKSFRALYTCVFHPLDWIKFNWGRTESRRFILESERYKLTIERNVLRGVLTSQGIRVVSDTQAKKLGVKS